MLGYVGVCCVEVVKTLWPRWEQQLSLDSRPIVCVGVCLIPQWKPARVLRTALGRSVVGRPGIVTVDQSVGFSEDVFCGAYQEGVH